MERLMWVYMFCAFILSGCGYDDFLPPEKGGDPEITAGMDIAEVRSLYGKGSVNVTDDVVVGGYVTANDKSGNIYRSFFIEDGTGAIEFRAGMYNLHNVYTRDRYVVLDLCGLSVSIYNGTLQVGLSVNESGIGVGYIDNWAVAADYLYPFSEYGKVKPIIIKIPDLTAEHCGRLVSFVGMKLVEEEPDVESENNAADDEGDFESTGRTWAIPVSAENPFPQSVSRYFEDQSGNRITVYTSGYANFAGNAIPAGRLCLTGILSYASTGYILKLRDLDDVEIEINN